MNDRVELWMKVDLCAELLGKSCNVKEKVKYLSRYFIKVFIALLGNLSWARHKWVLSFADCVNGRRNTFSG